MAQIPSPPDPLSESGKGEPVGPIRQAVEGAFPWIVSFLIALLVQAVLSEPMGHPKVDLFDPNFIVYRFAANLGSGHGLLYGTPNASISTYPLLPVLLALVKSAMGNFPIAGSVVFTVAVATGAVFLHRLVNRRWLATILYVVLLSLLPSPAIATMLALCLAALDQGRLDRWHLAGLFMGLAILADPSAIVFAVMALVWSIVEGRWRRYAVLVGAALVVGIGPVLLSYGLSVHLLAPAPSIVLLVVPTALVCLLPNQRTTPRGSRATQVLLASVAILIVVIFVSGDFPLPASVAPPQTAGEWIAANTGPDATLATTEIGALAFYADRPVIDLSGKLEQIPFDKYFFIHYAPDVVALRDGTDIAWKDITTTYDKKVIEGYAMYRRVVNFSPLDDHGVDVALGQQLGEGLGQISMHLSNVAIGNVLHPGDLVRIRLDWELAHPPSYPVEIRLNLLNDQGQAVKGVTDQIPASEWAAGSTSTYHLIVLPGDKVNDRLSLYLGVSVRGGDLLNILKVAEVTRAAPTS